MVSQGPDLILWAVRIEEGLGQPAIGRAMVTIRDGLIAAVERASDGPAPSGAFDLEGLVLLPGLIDAHVHVMSDMERSPGFGPPAPLHGEEPRPAELRWFILAKVAAAYLRAGLTTVRDVGAHDDEAIVLREAIRLGLADGPQILSCGRIVSATAPGGRIFGTMYAEADGPWAMRRAVREQIRRGADFIKLMATGARSVVREDPEPAQMTRDELEAAVDEAHRMGYRVAAHAEGLDGARLAIDAGIDTVEHGLSLHRAPELLDRMAAEQIVLVPTLSTFHDLADRFADQFDPRLVEQAKRQRDEALRTVAAARAAGVTIAMGYDSGPPGTNAREIVRLVEAGLSAREAIQAGTVGSAAALGLTDRGSLAVGMVADLIAVEGDPMTDADVLTDLSRIRHVILHGRRVAGAPIEGAFA